MKIKKNRVFLEGDFIKKLLLILLIFITGFAYSQELLSLAESKEPYKSDINIGTQAQSANSASAGKYQSLFQNGKSHYDNSRMFEAAAEFRQAQESAQNMAEWAQALYWVILAELALADYGSAVKDMDELESKAPTSHFNMEMTYHKGRIYFNLGYFEEALALFQRYIDSNKSTDNEALVRSAAAYFWMGECFYSTKNFDEAEKFFSWVLLKFPQSPKVEVAAYRIDLIKHKKIEDELLSLLHWSHEETLKTNEDSQRRIRTLEHTLNVYQRRIAEMTYGTEAFKDDSADINYPRQPDINNKSSSNELIDKAKQLESKLQFIINGYGQEGGSR